jgi:GNAT superfamily N-acetyltransferase
MGYVVRRLSSDEARKVAPLFDEYRSFYGQPSDLERATAFLTARMEASESIVYVAEEASAVIGFCQLFPSFSSVSVEPILILNDLFVRADSRKRGVGEALVQAAEALAHEQEVRRLVLETDQSNRPARALYQRLGWTPNVSALLFERSVTL